MDILGKTIWQQAAGDTNHDYVDLCLEWGVILNGPGVYGSWPDCEDRIREAGRTERKITDLRRFCEEMQDGDLVVLRLGTSCVYGVGIVRGYKYCEEFNDVDGWDIGHVRRVGWLWKYNEQHNGEPREFDTHTLKWGDTTQLLNAPDVELWLGELEISEDKFTHTPSCIPKTGDSTEISVDSISEYLFDKGVSSNSISSLLDQMGEFVRIANWYNRSGSEPSEHETVSYLVVPLLRALGWTPQRMAIEWNKIDVALFSSLPREDDSLSVVVEAKRKGASCLTAFQQARDYALEVENCRRLIVTDGLRYGIFTRKKDGESNQKEEFPLSAYMNLTRLRNEYPIYKCKGAKDALLTMAPEWQ